MGETNGASFHLSATFHLRSQKPSLGERIYGYLRFSGTSASGQIREAPGRLLSASSGSK